MIRTYSKPVIEQAKQKTLRAYRIVTEWLHGLCQLDRKHYTESQELIAIAQLYSASYSHNVLYIYHGWLYKHYPIFEAYFYLQARTFVHTTLQQRMSDWLQQLMWQYETEDKQLVTDILLLKFVRKRLYGQPYLDPEPVLKYVLDKRKEKERQEFQKRIQLWNRYRDDIVRMYKQANPFLTENDIWYIFLQTDITTWQQILAQTKGPKRKQKKRVHEIDQSVIRQLTITPDYLSRLFRHWWQTDNARKTNLSRRETEQAKTQRPTIDSPDWIITLENPFGLP